MDDDVARFYERFPYPAVSELVRPLPGDFARLALNHQLGRAPDDAIPEDADIWVAGCGTRQAVQVALAFPEAKILGTDLSAASLASTRKLAVATGTSERVILEQADLTEVTYEGRFDVVFCTGVLHHLPDPAAGARVIRRALRRKRRVAVDGLQRDPPAPLRHLPEGRERAQHRSRRPRRAPAHRSPPARRHPLR